MGPWLVQTMQVASAEGVSQDLGSSTDEPPQDARFGSCTTRNGTSDEFSGQEPEVQITDPQT